MTVRLCTCFPERGPCRVEGPPAACGYSGGIEEPVSGVE